MFVIYHKESTGFARVFRNGYWQDARFNTEAAAKAGLTRLVNKGSIKRDEYAIAEESVFHSQIEKMVTVTNLMTGKPVTQPVNTPYSCDVSMERYWTM